MPERKGRLAPVQDKPTMSGWKNGFEFQQKTVKKAEKTTSRYAKRKSNVKKKGTFEQRVKVDDAPHLMSVVTAKPEIKQKAKAEATERAKKKELKRKMIARISVKKPAPRQPESTWKSVLKTGPPALGNQEEQRGAMRGKKPPALSVDTSSQQIAESAKKANWEKAYQDIVSPQSGRHKLVPKQDLVTGDRILSPKKKTHGNTPPKPKLPPLDPPPLDDDEDAGLTPLEEVEPVPQREIEKPLAPRAVTPPKATKRAEEDNDKEEYVDVESDSSTEYEVPSMGHSQHEPKTAATGSTKTKQKLILEFALPSEDGADTNEPGLEVPVELQSLGDLSSVGSWPSIESNDSYDTRMNKMMQRWVDVNGGMDEDERTLYSNDVELEDNVLDHIVLATPDLEEAMILFEAMTGILPNPVGPLQGLGVKTAHVGLDENRYLEILAPDPDNPGALGEELAALPRGVLTPYYYSIRSSEVSRLIEGYVYDVLGWDPDHIAMVQALPDTSIRQWDLLTMYGHDVGGVAPCYVKWNDPSHHPTATIALKSTLTSCTVRAPKNHKVHKLIRDVDGIDLEYGDPFLACTIDTPKGSLTFSTEKPKGLVFPGYEDGQMLSDMPDVLPVSGDDTADEDYLAVGYDSES